MSTKRKVLLALAVLFTLVNAGGAVAAGMASEMLHMAGHVVLAAAGVLGVAAFAPRRREAAERLTY